MFKWSLLWLAALFLLTSLGCSYQINVQKSLVAEDELLPEISTQSPIAIIGQFSGEPGYIEFCKAGGDTFLTDYNEFTVYAVNSAKDILMRNSIQIDDQAQKQIVIEISNATCKLEFADIKFDMTLKATTGNGLNKEFTGYQRILSLHGVDFALSAAILNAVIEMFNDAEIRQFIEQT
jgi:hypothetical protein